MYQIIVQLWLCVLNPGGFMYKYYGFLLPHIRPCG